MEKLNIQITCSGVATDGDTATATFDGKISGPTKDHSLSVTITATYVGSECPFVEGNAYRLSANDA